MAELEKQIETQRELEDQEDEYDLQYWKEIEEQKGLLDFQVSALKGQRDLSKSYIRFKLSKGSGMPEDDLELDEEEDLSVVEDTPAKLRMQNEVSRIVTDDEDEGEDEEEEEVLIMSVIALSVFVFLYHPLTQTLTPSLMLTSTLILTPIVTGIQ